MADNSKDYISGEEYQNLKSTHPKHSKKVTLPVSYIGFVAVLIVVAILSFVGGETYQKHQTKTVTASSSSSQNSANGFFRENGGARRLGSFGQVTSVSSTSISVSDQRTSSSKTYTINSSTSITDNGQAVPASDIQTGDTVLIMPSKTDSSIAMSIIVNPSFGGGFQGEAPTGSATVNGSATSN